RWQARSRPHREKCPVRGQRGSGRPSPLRSDLQPGRIGQTSDAERGPQGMDRCDGGDQRSERTGKKGRGKIAPDQMVERVRAAASEAGPSGGGAEGTGEKRE